MKKMIIMLIVCGMVAALAGCGLMDVLESSWNSSRETEYSIKHMTGVVEITDEYFEEVYADSIAYAKQWLPKPDGDFRAIPPEECHLSTWGPDCTGFLFQMDQGGEEYLFDITWFREDGEWVVSSLKQNYVFVFQRE